MSLPDITRWLTADWTHVVAALGVLALGYALAGAAALVVILGAVSVRDSTLRQEAQIIAITARVSHLEAASGRRDTEDRITSSQIVRIQTTLETLQQTIARRLDSINQRLPAPH
jgi:hypothetical protein